MSDLQDAVNIFYDTLAQAKKEIENSRARTAIYQDKQVYAGGQACQCDSVATQYLVDGDEVYVVKGANGRMVILG